MPSPKKRDDDTGSLSDYFQPTNTDKQFSGAVGSAPQRQQPIDPAVLDAVRQQAAAGPVTNPNYIANDDHRAAALAQMLVQRPMTLPSTASPDTEDPDDQQKQQRLAALQAIANR